MKQGKFIESFLDYCLLIYLPVAIVYMLSFVEKTPAPLRGLLWNYGASYALLIGPIGGLITFSAYQSICAFLRWLSSGKPLPDFVGGLAKLILFLFNIFSLLLFNNARTLNPHDSSTVSFFSVALFVILASLTVICLNYFAYAHKLNKYTRNNSTEKSPTSPNSTGFSVHTPAQNRTPSRTDIQNPAHAQPETQQMLSNLANVMGHSSFGDVVPKEVTKEALYLNTFLDKPKNERDRAVMQEILDVAKCDPVEASLFGVLLIDALNSGTLPFTFAATNTITDTQQQPSTQHETAPSFVIPDANREIPCAPIPELFKAQESKLL